MLSFSVFASSYLARPFGSVFFGILGNRRGAGAALKLSMIGMAISGIVDRLFALSIKRQAISRQGYVISLKNTARFCGRR